jgi:hypothetical protein
MLMANPQRSSGDIFRELQRCSPGRYQPLQIRTHKPRNAENPSLSLGNVPGAMANRSDPRPVRHPCQIRLQRIQPGFSDPRQLNKPTRKILVGAMHDEQQVGQCGRRDAVKGRSGGKEREHCLLHDGFSFQCFSSSYHISSARGRNRRPFQG